MHDWLISVEKNMFDTKYNIALIILTVAPSL